MRKNLLATLLVSMSFFASFSQSSDYRGNGKSDFGGAVGLGKINITTNTDSVFFTFTKGPGLFDSVLVIYLDGQPGGITNTSGGGSSSDIYYEATSGYSTPTKQSIVNFPSNFQADAAIAFDNNGGEVFYWLFGFMLQGSSFTITPAGVDNARSYSARFAKTDLGISAGSTVNFNFIGTYIGSNCYRSTEGFGDTSATVSRIALNSAGNRTSGYNAYNPKSFFTYSSLNSLPVKLVDFKATKVGNEVAISWDAAGENGIDNYELQRSSDGIHFNTINIIKASNLSNASSYNVRDLNPAQGTNYYRLNIIERGKFQYSSVLEINFANLKNDFKATYATNNVNVSLNGIKAGDYSLSIINNMGQLIQVTSFVHDGSVVNKSLPIKSTMLPGIYRVALKSKSAAYITNIIVQ